MNPIIIDGALVDADKILGAYAEQETRWDGQQHLPTGKWRLRYSFGKENNWSGNLKSEHEVRSQISAIEAAQKGNRHMLKEITTDAKSFIQEHRNIIYWLALAFLADHFFFGGTFRARLNAMVEKMIGKVEKQLEAK